LPQASSVVHTVQVGENLYRISRQHGVSVEAIVQANGLSNADTVYVGQQLIIPPATGVIGNSPAAPDATSDESTTHVVLAGENLFRIALRHGLTVAQVQAANQLPNNLVYVGQQLNIPSGIPAAASADAAQGPGDEAKEIVVDLSEQRVYAYENGSLVRTLIVSTGVAATPTVQGEFRIYLRYLKQDMYGSDYYLPNVPYVQYFYQGYGLHGTYWHNNFGQPMSRGCVNLTIADSEWLYNWASIGTLVRVIP
jgi:LysM repeat protein